MGLVTRGWRRRSFFLTPRCLLSYVRVSGYEYGRYDSHQRVVLDSGPSVKCEVRRSTSSSWGALSVGGPNQK